LTAVPTAGFTLVEVLLVVLLLGIAMVPMMAAFKPALSGVGPDEQELVLANQARGTLHRALSVGYATLNANQGSPADLASLFGSAAEAAKEDFSFGGSNYTPVVSISDASGGTGGLLRVSVDVGEISFSTLKAND
jgi:prepilin-type N-terminal cleavage/methylation domain-containing protein